MIRRKMKTRHISRLFLFLIILTFFAAGCSRSTTQETARIQTLPATIGSIRKVITFVGNVTPAQTAVLTWQTSGVIRSVGVSLGDTVTQGQLIADLEPDSLPASVISAEVPLLEAMDQLEELRSSETPKAEAYKNLKDKESALQDAESYQESLKYPHATAGDIAYWAQQTEIQRQNYEDARAYLDEAVSWKHSTNESERDLYEARRKSMLSALNKYAETYNNYLYYSQPATDNQFAQAAAGIGTAKADYEQALRDFRSYDVFPRPKDITAAELRVENARTAYDRRSLTADISGTVTVLNARPGDYVTPGSTAIRIDNTEHLYIPLSISELDIPEIHDGMEALIVPDAEPQKTYKGVITTIPSSGDTSGSRVTFTTLIEILDPDPDLRIGMTAEVSIVVDEASDVLLVPANAVFTDQGSTYVNVTAGSSSYDVPVTVGLSNQTVTQITGGFLKEGDPVTVPSIDESILRALGISAEDPNSKQENSHVR